VRSEILAFAFTNSTENLIRGGEDYGDHGNRLLKTDEAMELLAAPDGTMCVFQGVEGSSKKFARSPRITVNHTGQMAPCR